MMVQSSRRHLLINKEEIINYQYEILEQSTPLAKPTISNSHKYSLWDLEAKIKEAVGDNPHSIRWIGNSQTAYLETYAYIMLIAASHSEANIVQFKHIIYKFGRECLNLPQQKLLVEFLCLIEYSRDRYAFLNKYPQIQALLIKILQYVEEDSPPSQDSAQEKKKAKVRRKTSGKTLQRSLQKKEQHPNATQRSKNSESQQTEYEKELQQIYSEFNKHFQFISLLGSNEYSCSLKLFQTKKIFVIIEKECYFMVQVTEKNPKTFLQFTLGNKFLSQNGREEIQQEIRAEIKAFDQKVYFNHEELDAIMDYHHEVQESKVIPIQRASQIRSPLNNKFGFSDSKKDHPQMSSQPRHSYINALADKSEAEFDKTLIDELITNPALNTQKEVNKQIVGNESHLPTHILNKKQKIMQKMKEFKKMKEAIQEVRQRIQGKLKRIEEVQHLKSQVSPKINEKRQSHNSNDRSIVHRKDQQLTNLFNQASVKFKLQAIANRKNSANIPTSLQSLPEPKNLEQLMKNHKSEHKIVQDTSLTNGKYLSQKAYSRPQSKVKSPQEQRSYSPKFKTIVPNRKGSLDVALIQPLSPNNVNVNVNVSINENLLNPRYTSPSSTFLKQQLQKYATNKQPANQPQQWYPPNYKWHQNPPNYYHTLNQEKGANTANPGWNASKSTNFYNRK